MNKLKEKYTSEIKEKLKQEFEFSNEYSIPKLSKIVVNIGVGEAKENANLLTKLQANLASLAGQKPVITLAKKSISSFKLTKGAPIGLMVTLRGERMYAFLEKLVNIVLPKVRDFRGVSDQSFDQLGNFNLGLREMVIFPEIDYSQIDKTRGLQVTINTTAKNKEQGKKLLELLGMPFMK